MKINLHLGVHKTATTAQQVWLAHNISILNRQGAGFMPLDEVRAWLVDMFRSASSRSGAMDRASHRFFKSRPIEPDRGILISDENILGTCGGLLTSGVLYGSLEQRLRIIRELLDGCEVNAFLSIRSYEEFLSSAYCEGLRGTKQFTPFTDFKTRLDMSSVSWPRLIAAVQNTLKPVKLKVWKYEKFANDANKIMKAMAFEAELPDFPITISQRHSFSQIGMNILQMVYEELGRDSASKLMFKINSIASRDSGLARFDPWTPEERGELNSRYVEHCANIDASLWI